MLKTTLQIEFAAGWVTEWPDLVIPADSFRKPEILHQSMVEEILTYNGWDESVEMIDAEKVRTLGTRRWVEPREFFSEDWREHLVSRRYRPGWVEVVIADLGDEKYLKEDADV